MKTLGTTGLLLKIFITTTIFSICYLIFGYSSTIPHILLFCLVGTFTLIPIELGIILYASKKEYGKYSLKSAFAGQEKLPFWKIILFALIFFGLAGLLSAFFAPIENRFFYEIRQNLLDKLPIGFDWTNYEYIKTFPKSMRILTCIYYSFFNVFFAPVTEELFFRGYLTSHYKKQNVFTPILIAVLFSLYHFWLPFNNLFRILAFIPASYVAYKKRNIYISMCFHCLSNAFSVVGFILAIL